MAASNMEVQSLDLAARTIDLTTALLKATGSTGYLVKGAWEIGQWLGREKLNQYELLDCMEKSKGLAFANKNGQGFFDEIIRGLDTRDTRKAWPLFLQQSGSLGRLMAGDPNLSWIVSTVACLFQHHRDDSLVTEMLTAFIMKSHRSREQGGSPTQDTGIYNPEQTRIRAVVRKIVSSVWFNVVNTGCDTLPLPEELLSVCTRGHYLEPEDFGIVVNTILTRCPSKAILKMNHLLRDVISWLLLHYDGKIIVTVGSHIVYKADLGNDHRELEVQVKSICPEDGTSCSGRGESYEIHHHISGGFEEFLRGYSFSDFTDVPPRPGIRQKLYEIPRPYPRDSRMWRRTLQITVECTARSIIEWLLDVPLSPQSGFSSPGFCARPGAQIETSDETTVSLILKRVPAIINFEWSDSPASQVVFRGSPSVEPDGFVDVGAWGTERQLAKIVGCFPILQDLLTGRSFECLCRECSERSRTRAVGSGSVYSLDSTNLVESCPRPGCLKRIALEEVLLLIAHGVADGFGISDISSVFDATPIIQGMALLLIQLVSEQRVYWDTWFAVASCVYLGCPFQQPVLETHPSFGGTSFAAIQYGNLASIASWLDLTKENHIRGCFGLIESRGRLGVITRSNDQHTQFRSVEENFAVIETEGTEDTTSFCSRYKKEKSLIDHRFKVDRDKSLVESDVILSQMDDKFYRLFLRIKTESHWRIVDPSDAFSGLIRLLPSTNCQHAVEVPEMPSLSALVYTMDELLGRWPDLIRSHNTAESNTGDDSASRNGGDFHVTCILDTHLKKNIALALSVCPTAVLNYPNSACITCTLDHADNMKRESLRDGEGGNPASRYIINLIPMLVGQDEAAWPRLLDIPSDSTTH
ncbi:hypothetical protein F4781DRAFT_416626 [Annulohypoxylon bovei var. microspora]|nr:hypothetical protein F4781DRAFT_416626 [Annulohypoxylon bovei var. microspora]